MYGHTCEVSVMPWRVVTDRLDGLSPILTMNRVADHNGRADVMR